MFKSIVLTVLATVTAALAALVTTAGAQAGSSTVFVPSVTVHGSEVTFPLRTGRTSDGRTFDFIVIEASNSAAASRWGVGVVNKLANVGDAAQPAHLEDGELVVAASVDFSPTHAVAGTPGTGWPPVEATPGSRGEDGYSPLVRLPDGSVLNAPQIGNARGLHDKVLDLDRSAGTVTLELTDGFARTNAVRYLSTDSSAEGPAALEGSTFAPRLALAPRPGDDSTASGRASLAAFVNGPTGAANPERQGINSALLGEGSPLNVLAWTPNQGRYSPLWDVHLTAWSAGVQPRRIVEFSAVEDLADAGRVTGLDGSAWGPNDVVVNCPIIVQL